MAGPEVLSLIGDLLTETPGAATDLEVAYVAGVLYWYRHLVLGSDGGQQELSEALRVEAKRRSASKSWFGHVSFFSALGRKP